jgi:hypothetical protein
LGAYPSLADIEGEVMREFFAEESLTDYLLAK